MVVDLVVDLVVVDLVVKVVVLAIVELGALVELGRDVTVLDTGSVVEVTEVTRAVAVAVVEVTG